jgi:transcriptional regulator with XRE-family HTH domain
LNLTNSQNFSIRFAAALKRRRLELGLSHDALAKVSGLSRSAISMIESGHRSASLISCHALSVALNTSVAAMAVEAEQGGGSSAKTKGTKA